LAKRGNVLPERETGTGAEDDHQSERGIFDCGDAYRTPVRADYERIFESGMVALDTNVLLNLYRSNERTRRDTFAVLSKLRDRLWIPHQVLAEFWRNRDLPSVRGHHRTKAKETRAALDKISRSMTDTLGRWLKDVHLSNDEDVRQHIDAAKESLIGTLESLKIFVQEQAEKDALEGTAATHTDPVLTELEQLLRGRIGDPLSDAEFENAVQEAQRRADKGIPPGYKDFQSKPPEQAAGDYVLWAQLLNEAEHRHSDVLLVTGDVKEDWWTPGDSQIPARPRTELRVELRQRAGGELFMLTPSQLLTEADEIFSLKVDERSVSDLATTESSFPEGPQYVHEIASELRTLFPEANILAFDELPPEQFIGNGPIPDIIFMHPSCRIGIELITGIQPISHINTHLLKETITAGQLDGFLIVSRYSRFTLSAIEYLKSVQIETQIPVKWIKLAGYADLHDLKTTLSQIIHGTTGRAWGWPGDSLSGGAD
jgi:predicted nucleic acid-binding protein